MKKFTVTDSKNNWWIAGIAIKKDIHDKTVIKELGNFDGYLEKIKVGMERFKS